MTSHLPEEGKISKRGKTIVIIVCSHNYSNITHIHHYLLPRQSSKLDVACTVSQKRRPLSHDGHHANYLFHMKFDVIFADINQVPACFTSGSRVSLVTRVTRYRWCLHMLPIL